MTVIREEEPSKIFYLFSSFKLKERSMVHKAVVFDIESDGLLKEANKIHCLVTLSFDIDEQGRVLDEPTLNTFQKDDVLTSGLPFLFESGFNLL